MICDQPSRWAKEFGKLSIPSLGFNRAIITKRAAPLWRPLVSHTTTTAVDERSLANTAGHELLVCVELKVHAVDTHSTCCGVTGVG